jgi:cytochrome c-type biogenesis protein
VGNWTNYAVALVFFVIGFHLLGVIDLPTPDAAKVRSSRRGPGAAFLLGAVFGIALGPCTFAYMTPVLTASLKAASTAPALAVGLLFAYGVGHCAVIVAAGGSVPLTQQILAWNGESKSSVVLRRVCGGLVIIGGLYLLWTAR